MKIISRYFDWKVYYPGHLKASTRKTVYGIFFFSGLASAFEKRKWNTEVVDFGVPYDFASIMHYPFTAFSKNGKPTIRNIVDMQGKTPYIVLSDGDARQTNAMYKCNGKEIMHLLRVNTVFISCKENRKQRKSVPFKISCKNSGPM